MREPAGWSDSAADRLERTVNRVAAAAKGGDGRASAFRFLQMAERSATQKSPLHAFTLCQKALSLCPQDDEVGARARGLLGQLVPGYHLSMMNDSRRNTIWDQALRRVIRPGMKVLEIGTGAGMLAMMAARAGAMVTTCEFHEVVAAVARDTIERNGLSDRIRVLAKGSQDLRVGTDLDERADLLFCDNFSDNFFSFDPLRSIADARRRLLKPGATCLPAAGSVHLALGDWSRYANYFQATEACGFDITPAVAFIPESKDLQMGDADVTLLSEGGQAFRFDFQAPTFPDWERVELQLEASQDCTVTGIIQWIRLELDEEAFVDSRPEPGATFFSNPRFHPLVRPRPMRAGEPLRVVARRDAQNLAVWAEAINLAAS